MLTLEQLFNERRAKDTETTPRTWTITLRC
jgi:hypothetical protein